MKKLLLLILIILVGAISFLIYAKFLEPNRLVISRAELFLPNWNDDLNGFKIGLISDIHIGTGNIDLKKLDKIVEKMNSQNPDLIILLGDFDAKYIKLSKIPQKDISQSLAKLKAPYGVISILGNHDYNPPEIVKNILQNANIKILENTNTFIYPENKKIQIIGFKDMWHYKLNPEKIIRNNCSNIPTIILSHNPDIFPKIPPCTTLTLSGHTHGGEIYVPIFGAPFIPSKFNLKYRKNYVVENNKHLYVSGGIGTLSGFRTFNPPEIVILTLNQQTKKNKITNTPIKKNFFKNHFKVPAIIK